jgi:TRAP-type C4-dicarboxylate transport system permease small subunit
MQVSPTLRLPMIYSQVSIFIGAILMFFYFWVELIDYFLQATGKIPLQTGGPSCEPVDAQVVYDAK